MNQGTISRELTTLGIRKVGGVYRFESPDGPPAPIHDFAVTSNGCLAVIKTNPAFASVVGQYVDRAKIPGATRCW